MSEGSANDARRRTLRVLVPLAILALVVKLVVSWECHGTSDIELWKLFLRLLRKEGGLSLCLDYPQFNHPPSVIRLLQAFQWLQKVTRAPLPFCIRLPGILADVGSLVVAFLILAPRLEERAVRTGLFLMAVAPASILVSGYHGNTDPIMVFFLLLCVLGIERPGLLWLAGIAMGLSVSVKIVPVVLWPLVFLVLRTTARRVAFFAITLATMFVAWMPYSYLAPWPILKKMLAYKSLPGVWGVSRILHGLPSPLEPAYAFYAAHGVWILLSILLAASLWFSRRRGPNAVFESFGRTIATFLAVTPGFGVQYLAWLVPWTGIAGLLVAVLFHVTSGAFLYMEYSGITDSLPWRVFGYGEGSSASLVSALVGLLCWGTIVRIAAGGRRRSLEDRG